MIPEELQDILDQYEQEYRNAKKAVDAQAFGDVSFEAEVEQDKLFNAELKFNAAIKTAKAAYPDELDFLKEV